MISTCRIVIYIYFFLSVELHMVRSFFFQIWCSMFYYSGFSHFIRYYVSVNWSFRFNFSGFTVPDFVPDLALGFRICCSGFSLPGFTVLDLMFRHSMFRSFVGVTTCPANSSFVKRYF